jgi:hypothetical protein
LLLVNSTEVAKAAERGWYKVHIVIPQLWFHIAGRGSIVMLHRERNGRFAYRLGIIGKYVHQNFCHD